MRKGGSSSHLSLKSLIMLIISMPTASLIQRLDALLKTLYGNSLERSCNSMFHTRISFSISENGPGMYDERLEHMILRNGVQDGEMLGTKLDDGHCFAVVTRHFSSHTELRCVVDCDFEGWDCGARQKKCAGWDTMDSREEMFSFVLGFFEAA